MALSDWLNPIGSVASGLIGGAFNMASTNQANKMNLQIARETSQRQHDTALELMDTENKFNVDMWNKTNEYNSPVALVQRYAAAGLNPGFMMSGQNASPAQNLVSSNPGWSEPPVPGMQATDFSPSAAQVGNAFQQAGLIAEETRGKKIENDNLQENLNLDKAVKASQVQVNDALSNLHGADAKKILEETRGYFLSNNITEDGAKDQLRKLKSEADRAESEADKAIIEAAISKIEESWAPVFNEQKLKNMQAEEAAAKSVVAANKAQAAAAYQMAKESVSRVGINEQHLKKLVHETRFAEFSADDRERLTRAWNGLYEDRVHFELNGLRAYAEKLEADKELSDEERGWMLLKSITNAAAVFGFGKAVSKSISSGSRAVSTPVGNATSVNYGNPSIPFN